VSGEAGLGAPGWLVGKGCSVCLQGWALCEGLLRVVFPVAVGGGRTAIACLKGAWAAVRLIGWFERHPGIIFLLAWLYTNSGVTVGPTIAGYWPRLIDSFALHPKPQSPSDPSYSPNTTHEVLGSDPPPWMGSTDRSNSITSFRKASATYVPSQLQNTSEPFPAGTPTVGPHVGSGSFLGFLAPNPNLSRSLELPVSIENSETIVDRLWTRVETRASALANTALAPVYAVGNFVGGYKEARWDNYLAYALLDAELGGVGQMLLEQPIMRRGLRTLGGGRGAGRPAPATILTTIWVLATAWGELRANTGDPGRV